jgi:hypothetical protein
MLLFTIYQIVLQNNYCHLLTIARQSRKFNQARDFKVKYFIFNFKNFIFKITRNEIILNNDLASGMAN